MLDFSNFAKDFEALADRWTIDSLLRTNRNFRHQRVARMIAARAVPVDNLFVGTHREYADQLDDHHDNIFA